jgi:hypothetical protein
MDAQVELPGQPADVPSESQPAADESPEPKETAQETIPITGEETPAEHPEDVPPANDGGEATPEPDPEPRETEHEEVNPPPPAKPSLVEIYAKQRGFRSHVAEKCFMHPDGRWIEKSESPFNWEERAPGGELLSSIWVTEQKLANGVEIAAQLWTLMGQQPRSTMMVVVGEDHAPCALTGQELWRSTKLTRLCSVKLTQAQYSRGKLFFFPSSVVLSR